MIGTSIDHYRILETLGQGGMGEVYLAEDVTLDRLLTLSIPLADAVAAAHDQGITHRDLKPANVMVSPEGG